MSAVPSTTVEDGKDRTATSETPAIRRACKQGDLDALNILLRSYNEQEQNHEELYVSDIIAAAAEAGQVATVHWLIEKRFPEFTPTSFTHQAAFNSGVNVYQVFVSKWPYLPTMEMGHLGSPLGVAVFTNKPEMVAFLLEQGVDPNKATIFHRPMQNFLARYRSDRKECVKLLLLYGFVES